MDALARTNTQRLAGRYPQTGNEEQSSGPSDEHTGVQVDLSILMEQLAEIINESHTELESRAKLKKNSPNLAELS